MAASGGLGSLESLASAAPSLPPLSGDHCLPKFDKIIEQCNGDASHGDWATAMSKTKFAFCNPCFESWAAFYLTQATENVSDSRCIDRHDLSNLDSNLLCGHTCKPLMVDFLRDCETELQRAGMQAVPSWGQMGTLVTDATAILQECINPPSAPPSSPPTAPPATGLSVGAIVGISVGSFFGLGFLIMCFGAIADACDR